MELEDVEGNVTKIRANITKLGKAETDDKDKAAALKALDDVIKEMKGWEKTRSDLQKRIKDAKKLADDLKKLREDVDKYRTDYGKFVTKANNVGTQLNKCKPDTKARDYFMLANRLGQVGQVSTMDDIPGSP